MQLSISFNPYAFQNPHCIELAKTFANSFLSVRFRIEQTLISNRP